LPAYSVLQQQLIDARDRLDREVNRLRRMHAFHTRALRLTDDAELVPAIGEAIVDIFEIEFGICWLLDDAGDIAAPIGALGIVAPADTLRETGQRLASFSRSAPDADDARAMLMTPEALALVAPKLLIDKAIHAACLAADGTVRAVLLGGNTRAGADFFDAPTPELREAFGLFAQQLGALLENRHGHAIIERQVAEIRQANRDLEHERGFLRALIGTIPDLVWLKDPDGVYLACNPRFERFFGAPQREIVGKTDYDFVDKELADFFRDHDRLAVAKGGPSANEEWIRFADDGHRELVEATKTPMFDNQGRLIGVLGISHDITERQRIEAELEAHRLNLEELVQQRTVDLVRTEAKASHILHSSADGLYGVDAGGRITFINPAACALLGHRAEAVIGKSAHRLFHHSWPDGSPYPPDRCPSHDALRLGKDVRVDDEVYWHADGHAVPVMYAIHPMIQNGRNSGAVISFVDISAQRAAAQATEQALAAAENLARVRSEFLANMSHEIRTPLNGVLGFAQIGYRHYQNSEKARNAFEKIVESGKRLLAVVDEVLDFSKIEAGKLAIEQTEVDLVEVVDRAIDLIGDRARAKQIELRVLRAADLPRTCVGDGLRIGQVLLNLLSNAVKFTEAGSVAVSVSRQERQLVFQVTDMSRPRRRDSVTSWQIMTIDSSSPARLRTPTQPTLNCRSSP
jgi:hypothetical protein